MLVQLSLSLKSPLLAPTNKSKISHHLSMFGRVLDQHEDHDHVDHTVFDRDRRPHRSRQTMTTLCMTSPETLPSHLYSSNNHRDKTHSLAPLPPLLLLFIVTLTVRNPKTQICPTPIMIAKNTHHNTRARKYNAFSFLILDALGSVMHSSTNTAPIRWSSIPSVRHFSPWGGITYVR